MTTRIEIDDALLAALHAHTILPSYNAKPPARGSYGWLTSGLPLDFDDLDALALEECTGLYGGAYKPLPGASTVVSPASAPSATRTPRCPSRCASVATARSRRA
jgi:hypothetical protein